MVLKHFLFVCFIFSLDLNCQNKSMAFCSYLIYCVFTHLISLVFYFKLCVSGPSNFRKNYNIGIFPQLTETY